MIIHKTYKFRLLPTKEQEILLSKHFGCARFVYNHFLCEHKRQYETTKNSDSFSTKSKKLTLLKKRNTWLKDVNSQSLQSALISLDKAYKRFFNGLAEYPKLKCKRNRHSFTIPQTFAIRDGRIKIPKFSKGIKLIQHQELRGDVRKMVVSKTPTNKYYVSILTKQEIEIQPFIKKSVGLDLGLKHLVITSDGDKFENKRYRKSGERKLKKSPKALIS